MKTKRIEDRQTPSSRSAGGAVLFSVMRKIISCDISARILSSGRFTSFKCCTIRSYRRNIFHGRTRLEQEMFSAPMSDSSPRLERLFLGNELRSETPVAYKAH